MNKKNLGPGIKLDVDFDGYPVSLHKSQEEYYVECKDVFISRSSYKTWKKNPRENLFGYTLQGRECRIDIINSLVRIGCLKDTEQKFNKIIITVNKYIRNDKSNNSSGSKSTKEYYEHIRGH